MICEIVTATDVTRPFLKLRQSIPIGWQGKGSSIGVEDVRLFLASLPEEIVPVCSKERNWIRYNKDRKIPPLPFELSLGCRHGSSQVVCLKVFFDGDRYVARLFHVCHHQKWQRSKPLGRQVVWHWCLQPLPNLTGLTLLTKLARTYRQKFGLESIAGLDYIASLAGASDEPKYPQPYKIRKKQRIEAKIIGD